MCSHRTCGELREGRRVVRGQCGRAEEPRLHNGDAGGEREAAEQQRHEREAAVEAEPVEQHEVEVRGAQVREELAVGEQVAALAQVLVARVDAELGRAVHLVARVAHEQLLHERRVGQLVALVRHAVAQHVGAGRAQLRVGRLAEARAEHDAHRVPAPQQLQRHLRQHVRVAEVRQREHGDPLRRRRRLRRSLCGCCFWRRTRRRRDCR